LQNRQKEVPNLISAHLGNRVPDHAGSQATAPIRSEAESAENRGAANRRSREDGSLERQAGAHQEQTNGCGGGTRKMPFEVTPFMPYLMRYGSEPVKPIAARPDAKAADAACETII